MKTKRFYFLLWTGLLLLLSGPCGTLCAADDDLAARVIILANARQPESLKLAEFYAGKRGVPVANIVALPMPEEESITWRQFIDQVYQPVQDELYKRGWLIGTASNLLDAIGRRRYAFVSHRISYLVVCRGVPLRIGNDPVLLAAQKATRPIMEIFNKNEAAVDAELSLLAQSNTAITAFVGNPLFANEHPTRLDEETIVKVSRLDGPTAASARNLVESALTAERQGLAGRYYVDLQGPVAEGDEWLESTRVQLVDLGFDGEAERTPATLGAAARFDAPVFYFGWYRGDFAGPMAAEGFRFPPGAVALHIHSFSAQTVRSVTQSWCGPLIARGVTATVGNVFEPYLGFTHRPNLLLRGLAQGKTFGDAVYYSLPSLSWQAVALGDPLYRPFRVSLAEQEAAPGLLPPTLAPYVVMRRAQLLWQKGQKAEARAVLQAGLRQQPSLALGLAAARFAAADKDAPAVQSALGFVPLLKKISGADWPLAQEAAGLLAAHGAAPAALKIYAVLAAGTAPSPDALKTMLAEGRNAADAAQDLKMSLYFSQRMNDQVRVPGSK